MAMRHFILDDNHIVQPCPDLMTWVQWFAKADRHVGKTVIGELTVSTVFLGLDHDRDPDKPPVLFETMIFGGAFAEEEYQQRCATWAQAEEQHERACRLARAEAAMSSPST